MALLRPLFFSIPMPESSFSAAYDQYAKAPMLSMRVPLKALEGGAEERKVVFYQTHSLGRFVEQKRDDPDFNEFREMAEAIFLLHEEARRELLQCVKGKGKGKLAPSLKKAHIFRLTPDKLQVARSLCHGDAWPLCDKLHDEIILKATQLFLAKIIKNPEAYDALEDAAELYDNGDVIRYIAANTRSHLQELHYQEVKKERARK
jgi:hypothetical protein